VAQAPKSNDPDEPVSTRIAPDPFTAVLPALAALGAIASIATVNWVAEEKTPERARSKRKASAALRDLESCCMGMQEIFKRFHKSPKLFGGEGAASASPMKFGVHGPRIGPRVVRLYQQSMNDIASMLILAAQNAFDVMAAIEDGDIDPPEEVFFGFGEVQEQLNQLLQQRDTLKTTVETGAQISFRLTKLVQELKRHHNS